jgi:hypothetical protein
MRINACALSFELTPAIARHVEGRLRLSLATASEQIDVVLVRLWDINGTRGGTDKRCQVVVRRLA